MKLSIAFVAFFGWLVLVGCATATRLKTLSDATADPLAHFESRADDLNRYVPAGSVQLFRQELRETATIRKKEKHRPELANKLSWIYAGLGARLAPRPTATDSLSFARVREPPAD